MTNYEIVIKPKQRWQLLDLTELWRYRELFYIFTWRDIKVRYKQTFLGIAWVVFQPLVTTGIFTIFFGRLAKIPSGNLPYELFVLTGLVFWTFFSQSLSHASSSLIENINIIKKVYFPKEILPISASITGLVDLSINFVVLTVAVFLFGFSPSLGIFIILPIVILITIFTVSGLGMFLASVNIKYRDVRYILPFFIQTMLFVTPVIYPTATVRDSLRPFFALNPMTAVVESMRLVVAGSTNLDWRLILVSSVSSLLIFLLGLWYFRQTERFFADIA